MTDRWALCAYPLSAAYLSKVRPLLGEQLQPAVLSEMRRSSVWSLLGTLRRVRAAEGFVLLEDTGHTPLRPVLQFLLSLTRCKRLLVLDATLQPQPFSRARAYGEAPALLLATLVGLFSAFACWLELRRLRHQRPLDVPRAPRRRAAVLRTNLWFGLKAGGSVGHTAGVINALARHCERVDVLSPDLLPMVKAPANVITIPSATRNGYPYELNYYSYHRRFVRKASPLLRNRRPDFLYHRISLGGYAGVPLSRRLGVPLVVEYNGSEVWVSRHWGAALWLPQLATDAEEVPLRLAHVVTTVSDVLGDELRSRGVPEDRIVVHPNGVDPDTFDPARFDPASSAALRQRLGFRPDDVVCTFIGTFGRWHGVTLLAEVIRDMVRDDRAWLEARRVKFLFVGDGLFMKDVRELLSEATASGYATLTGLVPQHEAPQYLAASDILLSPHVPNPDGSRFFGSPTKLFEYMAMSRAIVASELEQIGTILQPGVRIGAGVGDVPPDAVALLTTPGDGAQLRAGIQFLADRPDLRTRLGANARQRVLSNYTWDHNVRAVLDRLNALHGAA